MISSREFYGCLTITFHKTQDKYNMLLLHKIKRVMVDLYI
jgi:hypothetical protein